MIERYPRYSDYGSVLYSQHIVGLSSLSCRGKGLQNRFGALKAVLLPNIGRDADELGACGGGHGVLKV
jgi:hypothetical protein